MSNKCSMSSDALLALQVAVQQQTQEVDNAETAALVAIDDREEAVRKLNVAQRHLEDAKGKQQHSLQVTTNSAVSPEVSKHNNHTLCQSWDSAEVQATPYFMQQHCCLAPATSAFPTLMNSLAASVV